MNGNGDSSLRELNQRINHPEDYDERGEEEFNHRDDDFNRRDDYINRKIEIFRELVDDARSGKIKYVEKNYKFDFVWNGKQLCSPITVDWKVVLNDNTIIMLFYRRNSITPEEIIKRRLLNVLYNLGVDERD